MLRWLRGLSVTLVLIASIVIGALLTVQGGALTVELLLGDAFGGHE